MQTRQPEAGAGAQGLELRQAGRAIAEELEGGDRRRLEGGHDVSRAARARRGGVRPERAGAASSTAAG